MSSENIKNLVDKAKNGDADAFGELYSIYATDMYRFAFYYTGTKQLAEDAVSDAVLSAFQKISQLKKTASFKSWLFKILFNCCKQKQKEKIISSNQVELSVLENSAVGQNDCYLRIDLRNALNLLTKEEREIVILAFACKYKSGKSPK